jgi:hypothetical protein
VFGLTNGQKLALQAAMPRLHARRMLERYGHKMTADGLYDCVLRATGSRDAAEQAAIAKLSAQLRAGEQVG